MELKDYTTEELRNEIERRRRENVKKSLSNIEYKKFTAVVKSIDKSRYPFRCRIENPSIEYEIPGCVYHDYALKRGVFVIETAPRIGDVVMLAYRRTKINAKHEIFDVCNAKIIEVIARKNQ